jgi:asparagine synthase (glutamine-hydrolysing)
MCGIAGILTFDGRPVDVEELTSLTHALAHRGKDHAATVVGGLARGQLSAYPGIGLGHRRLSIIDLSSDSDQPMRYGTPPVWITYNGELYNFEALRAELVGLGCRFRTGSDTEVVLAAYSLWGESCLTRFNGMFAFALWDEAKQTLFCARDALGIKPFYYSHDGGAFRFASEARALARLGRHDLDPDAVTAYLLSMYVPGHRSMFATVSKLLPGRFMRVGRDGTVVIRQFWRPPAGETSTTSAEAAALKLRGLLDRAVAMQLRSDVPVGALLSGGFDSGMIVASAAQAGATLHTYSAGFDDSRQVNELPIARALAARYGTRHRERVIKSDELAACLDRAMACMSEPVADSAVVPTYCLAEMAAEDGVKVLLSGTGGDEVFAGYPRYIGTALPRRLLLGLPQGLRRRAADVLGSQAALSARLRHRGFDMLMTTGGSPRLARLAFADERAFATYLEKLAADLLPPLSPAVDPLYEHMQFDLTVYLPDLLLMLLDQLTMAHTVEGRVPLLDVDLIAASYRLPAALHASSTETRRLMRRMAVDRVDPRTLTAPKQGFSGPVGRWMTDNRETVEERTMAVRDIPALSSIPVAELWAQGAADGNPRWAMEVFSLFAFATWYYGHATA